MGNEQSNAGNFNSQKYCNKGLTQDEVMGLRNVFEQMDPKVRPPPLYRQDGVIETATLKRLYRDSYDAPALNGEIGSRETLNFDQFFEIMSKNMLEKKKQFAGDVEFDEAEDVQCIFCRPFQVNDARRPSQNP